MFILIMGILLSITIISSYFLLNFEIQEEIRAVVFSSFVIFEMFKVFIVQHFEKSLSLENIRKNKMLFVSIISTILAQILVIYLFPTQFKIAPLSPYDWLVIFGFGMLLLSIGLISTTFLRKNY